MLTGADEWVWLEQQRKGAWLSWSLRRGRKQVRRKKIIHRRTCVLVYSHPVYWTKVVSLCQSPSAVSCARRTVVFESSTPTIIAICWTSETTEQWRNEHTNLQRFTWRFGVILLPKRPDAPMKSLQGVDQIPGKRKGLHGVDPAGRRDRRRCSSCC